MWYYIINKQISLINSMIFFSKHPPEFHYYYDRFFSPLRADYPLYAGKILLSVRFFSIVKLVLNHASKDKLYTH